MAITASSVGTSYQVSTTDYNTRYEARIYLKVNSQSITDNTSNVTVWWTMKKIAAENYGAYCLTSSSKVSLTINGSTDISSGTTAAWDLRTDDIGTEITLYSRTVTISHGTDGTKTIGVSGYHDPGNSWDNIVLSSVDVTLPQIARASTFSVSSSSVTMTGSDSLTVSITRMVSTYTHKITFALESYSQSYSSVATSKSYTVPITWNNALPNNTSGTMTITVDTYNGSIKVGSASSTVTAYVPSTIVPTMASFTSARVDGDVPSSWGVYVQSKSKATLSVGTCAGSYGSTIIGYKITGDGNTATSTSLTTAYLTSSGTVTFTAVATDSRNRTVTKTVSITVYSYSSPKSTDTVVVERCDSSGNLSYLGTYLCIIPKYSYSSVNGNNTFSISAKYKYSTSWSSSVSLNNNLTNIIGGSINAEYNYTVQISLTDYFGTVTQTFTVPMFYSSIDVYKTGKGVAIGAVATQEDVFEVDMPAQFNYGIQEYKRTQAGRLLFDIVAETVIQTYITFPVPFSSTPSLSVVPETSFPQKVFVSVSGVSETGFYIYIYRTTEVDTGVQWVAVERD
ncbi:MAG: DUF859 family phage minor structural protein [Clostridia bacterium]